MLDDMLKDAQDVWGAQATYTPIAGAPFAITVVRQEEDVRTDFGNGTRTRSDAGIFEARQSVFALPPARGDKLILGSKTWVVKSFSVPDPDDLLWLIECYPDTEA